MNRIYNFVIIYRRLLLSYKYNLVIIYRRLLLSYKYNKDNFKLKYTENVFELIKDINYWTSLESISGPGSNVKNTLQTKKMIEDIIEKYNIKTILDIPCGDFNWMKTVKLKDCNYFGADIVQSIVDQNSKFYAKENIEFKKLNLTYDCLPKTDLIICKDCLQHLSNENVIKSLKNLVNSGSQYLLITSYPLTIRNYDIYDGDYRALNLFLKPFKLNEYLLKKTETGNFELEIDKNLYLFDMTNNAFNKFRIK